MKKVSAILAAVFMIAAVTSTRAAQIVTADGLGATRAVAIANAQTNAIQKAVGVFIASETLTKNFMLAKDMIFSKAEGFVKKYTVLSSSQGPDGSFSVTIEAEVDAVMDNLIKDEAAVDLLLQWVNRPKFMVVLDETDAEGNSDMVAETQIIKVLRERRFQVVDREQLKTVMARDKTIAEIADNPAAAAAMAVRLGAQIIVGGKCAVKAVSHPALGSSVSGQANISAKIVNADNAEIIATDSYHGKFVHIDPLTAGKRAALQAADGVINYLIAATIREWGHQKANAATFQLTISGMEYPHKTRVANCLQYGVEGVSEVITRSFSAGVGDYQVKYQGSADDLGGVLYGKECDGIRLIVYEQTGNTLKLKIEK